MNFVSSRLISGRGPIGVILNGSRPLLRLAVGSFRTTSNIAHVALFTWADRSIVSEGRHTALTMKPSDLQLAKLHVEICDEVFKDVSAL